MNPLPPPCLVCDKILEAVRIIDNDDPIKKNQPYAAAVFTSRGHYGSTVFDEINGNYLELNICDECLRVASHARKVLFVQPRPPVRVDPIIQYWNEEEE